ncbi:phage tail protein [Vibrio sp. YMD68]|uniref:phage tail protein n=1 Tax=Vibrio sp. YMD68 TaxID=3042300 RepID=UPI00249A1851|nr:phage tail protein [Vibrio sp. YMD68]WGV98816.1 phage tail protein [Vibrio sp. YMD68]WGW01257.1 phage tail protein [Vibrio sp. YMD68]
MSDIMLQLGDFPFSVSTAQYQQLVRRTQFRWGKRQRHMLKSTAQFLGAEADSITLNGTFYPKVTADLNLMPTLREQGKDGKPFLLVSGNQKYGQFHGSWFLETLEETNTYFLRDGTPRKIEFNLSISELPDE